VPSVNFWFQSDPGAAKIWVKKQIESDTGLCDFLSRTRHIVYIVDNPPRPTDVEFSDAIFDWFEDVAVLKARVESLDRTQWTELDKAAADKFLWQAGAWITSKSNQNETENVTSSDSESN
jgi:hypothetical protein